MNSPVDITLPAARAELAHLRAGCAVRLFGTIYTMRDAGHERALKYLAQHGELPFSLAGEALFYAGPTPQRAGRPVGAIGPTTASRMDAAAPTLYEAGITLTLGKGKRSARVAAACAATGGVYLVAVGGAAAYLASFVTAAEPVAWEELGTEALVRLTLNGLPAFVGIDSKGQSAFGERQESPAGQSCAPSPAQGCAPSQSSNTEPSPAPSPSPSIQASAQAPPSAQTQASTPPPPINNPLFISFEGGEGVGKSTQIRLLEERLTRAGYTVLCLREPGGTEVGEHIRHILLNPAHTAMSATTELLLYEAARAQLVQEVILPALKGGAVVLVDRFFDSTTAYQSYARGLDPQLVERANAMGAQGLAPTRTILLEHDLDYSLAKATVNGADRMEAESRAFHERVHAGFAALADAHPQRIKRVSCAELHQDTHNQIFKALADLFNEQASQSFEITSELLECIKAKRDAA